MKTNSNKYKILTKTFIFSVCTGVVGFGNTTFAGLSSSSPSASSTPKPSSSPSGTYWDDSTDQNTNGNCTPSASPSKTPSPTPTPSTSPSAGIPIFWPEGCSAEVQKYSSDGDGHKKGDSVLDSNGKPVWQCTTPPRAWNGTVNGAACSSGSCTAVDMNKCYPNGTPKCSCAK